MRRPQFRLGPLIPSPRPSLARHERFPRAHSLRHQADGDKRDGRQRVGDQEAQIDADDGVQRSRHAGQERGDPRNGPTAIAASAP